MSKAIMIAARIQEWLRQYEAGSWAKDGADIGIIEAERLLREISEDKRSRTSLAVFLDSLGDDTILRYDRGDLRYSSWTFVIDGDDVKRDIPLVDVHKRIICVYVTEYPEIVYDNRGDDDEDQ